MTAVSLVTSAYDTPFGQLTVLATPDDGVVRAAGFGHLRDVATQLDTRLGARGWEPGDLPLVARAIELWLDGDASELMNIPVAQPGGPFFQQVWALLRTVPSGQVVSYRELAEMAGRPRAMRAAGTACARNTVGIFVPCHRVIRSGGWLGSYGFGGTDIKAAMLIHEGVHVAHPGADARVTVTT